MKFTTEKAYAKINYLLHVGKKRSDGFHEIATMMQTISLADELTVGVSCGKEISLSVTGNSAVPCDSSNLVWKAAALYLETIGESCTVEMKLNKNIPMAGGLAGGSADAAAALRALNRLFDDRLDFKQLEFLSARLGSDIPFCLYGGLYLCTGRGEQLKKMRAPTGLRHFLIVNRGESVSTPQAYAALDACPRELVCCIDEDAFSESLEKQTMTLYNSFEDVILPLCPLANEAKELLSENGAVTALMSGSGSTVFGLFETKEAALRAQTLLPFKSYYATDIFPIGADRNE